MKKRIIILVAIGLVLAVVAACATWYVVSTQVVKKDGPVTPTEPLSPYKQTVKSGTDAEKKGKTKDALASYKKARTMCKDDDTNCKLDMDMKIKLMELALKQEGVKPSTVPKPPANMTESKK